MVTKKWERKVFAHLPMSDGAGVNEMKDGLGRVPHLGEGLGGFVRREPGDVLRA